MKKYPCPQYEPCPHMLPNGECGLDNPADDCDDYGCEYGLDGDDEDEPCPCNDCAMACGCDFDDTSCRALNEYLDQKGL